MRFIPLGRLGDVATDTTAGGSTGIASGTFSAAALRAMTQVRPEILARLGPDFRTSLQVGGAGAASGEQCRCMLDQVPEVASGDPAIYQQGLQVCMQDPAAFAAQLRSAGYDPGSCGAESATPWYRTTVGMVGIGAGVLALAGAAFVALR